MSKIVAILFLTLVSSLGLLVIFTPTVSYAAGDCDDLKSKFEQYGGREAEIVDKVPQYCTSSQAIKQFLNIAFVLIGIISTVFLVIGGIKMIAAAGNEQQYAAGKQTAMYAGIGLAIVLAASAIVNIVINLLARGS